MYPNYHLDFGFMPPPDFISRFHDVEGSVTAGEGEDTFEEAFLEADVDRADGAKGDDGDDDDNNDDTSDEDASKDREDGDSNKLELGVISSSRVHPNSIRLVGW